jgi:hypothetical protein|tara:strand:- start:811 stop:1038 length:228 start_codon:yes stop_codon:yes gene_type:complete
MRCGSHLSLWALGIYHHALSGEDVNETLMSGQRRPALSEVCNPDLSGNIYMPSWTSFMKMDAHVTNDDFWGEIRG